jgi:hypothetical protein
MGFEVFTRWISARRVRVPDIWNQATTEVNTNIPEAVLKPTFSVSPCTLLGRHISWKEQISPETSVFIYQNTWHHIAKHCKFVFKLRSKITKEWSCYQSYYLFLFSFMCIIYSYLLLRNVLLGSFTQSQKQTISYVVSVSAHVSERFPLDRFPWNFVLETSIKKKKNLLRESKFGSSRTKTSDTK